MKKILFLTLSLVLVYNFAFASVYDINEPTKEFGSTTLRIDSSYSLAQGDINGVFFHAYEFDLPNSAINFGVISLFFSDVTGIDNFIAALYDSGRNLMFEATLTTLPSFFNAQALNFSDPNLTGGTYYLGIGGEGVGSLGGSYSGNFVVSSSVPVPGAALLLGTGLLGLVGLRRRQIV